MGKDTNFISKMTDLSVENLNGLEGYEKGAKQEKQKIAKKLQKAEYSENEICKITGLKNSDLEMKIEE